MKNTILAFLVSAKGSIIIPLVTSIVAAAAGLDPSSPDLTSAAQQSAVAGWVVAFVMASVNYITNRAQTKGVEAIQQAARDVQFSEPSISLGQRAVNVDGIPGPITTKVVTDLLGKLADKK
jgi:hypothetical protein